ncbi:hypothetical protein PG984_005613 [Apiospora sp. TS-2023a]
MALDIGVWSKVPAVAHFCENAEKVRGRGYVACLYLPTPEFLWTVGIALFVWFLPDLIWWTTDAVAFVCLSYRRLRRREQV